MYILKKHILEENTNDLYQLLCNPDITEMPYQSRLINAIEFSHWLEHQLTTGFYHDLYLIYDDIHIVGYMLAYDYRIYDGHCQINGYMKNGMKAEVLLMFVERLCLEYPLRKLLLETIDEDMLAVAKTVGFNEEALLKEYKYKDSIYYDLHILSYRSQNHAL
ncbi:MAG: GNAT family N-acetyltransferase [Erysipelotrichaceae bacterium]|nr:GNAT family N-acetyltransferase [Erysipelotrichaceae bacterium]